MANAMSTSLQPPPSKRKLFLLSTYALVAYSVISMASSVANSHINQRFNTVAQIVPTEERVGLKDAVQVVEDVIEDAIKQLSLNKVESVDHLISDKMHPTVSSLLKTSESEEAADTVNNAPSAGIQPMKSLFNDLLLKNQAVGRQGELQVLGELARQIVNFKAHSELPIPESSIVAQSADYRATDKLQQQINIVVGLEPSLQTHLKVKRLSPDDFFEMLNVDVNSASLFNDLTVLPRIEFLAEHTDWIEGGPFDLLLSKFPEPRNDFEIASKLVAARADSNSNSVAGQLIEALFRAWDAESVDPITLLPKLLPDPEEVNILSGSLKVWTEYFKLKALSLKQVYTTLLLHLLHPGADLHSLDLLESLPRNKKKELVVADMIGIEWAKDFDDPSGASNDLEVSPLARLLFFALSNYWISHKLKVNDVETLLSRVPFEDQLAVVRRRDRVLYMFEAYTAEPDKMYKFVYVIRSVRLAEVVAMELEHNGDVFTAVEKCLFKDWSTDKVSTHDAFVRLKLPSPDKGLFQKRLFSVWYLYSEFKSVKSSRLEKILEMREYLTEVNKGKDFEPQLVEAVLASDGYQQRFLFTLLAARWIKEDVQVSDIPLLHSPSSSNLKSWYEEELGHEVEI